MAENDKGENLIDANDNDVTSAGPQVAEINSNSESNSMKIDDESIFDSSKPEQNIAKALDEVPPYCESEGEGFHTWKIEDITAFLGKPKEFGPKFKVGDDHIFNPLIMASKHQDSSCFSVYLEGHPADSKESESDDWHFCAQFALDIWNPDDPSQHKINSTHFRYNPRVTDWGFINLLDGKNSLDSEMIEHKSVNVTCYVRLIKDNTGVLWYDFINYDSKKATGYVGLNNQGATCYLNSLLQSYFTTKKFRQKVYEIPTQDEIKYDMPFKEYLEQPRSVSLALQRIFYKLQTSDKPVDTNELTESFGWNDADAFTQHDVQEMNRILMDKLETRMKHTDIEGCLNDIFVGKMKSFIRCLNVDYESSRIEEFWDIQLNVKGLKNIRDSFENYIALELLDGENKYDAAGYGLQAAHKGVSFENFPSVLHLQLKRFEYDFEYDQLVKVNDRYEFFDKLDLKPYIDKDAQAMKENWEYELHGVLVHQGDVSMGHYYAMIKPTEKDEWFRFDDDKVWRVTPDEVFEGSFGANQDPEKLKKMSVEEQQDFQLRRHTSAYMLVYIRKSAVKDILTDIKESDIPPHIPKQINYEREQYARLRKEKEEMHLYANFEVFYHGQFAKYQGFDLGPNEDDTFNYCAELYKDDCYPLRFRLLKTETFNKVFDTVSSRIGRKIDGKYMRFWVVDSRKNYALRPYEIVDFQYGNPESEAVTIDHIIEQYDIANTGYRSPDPDGSIEVSLYLEDCSTELKFVSTSVATLEKEKKLADNIFAGKPNQVYDKCIDTSLEHFTPKLEDLEEGSSKYMIFIKYFDYQRQQLLGLCHVIVPSESKVDSLTGFLNKILGYPMDTRLLFSEELGPEQIEPISPEKTFYKAELGNGDIVCFAKADINVAEEDEFKNKSIEEMYGFLANRIHFEISPLVHVDEDEEEYVDLKKKEAIQNKKFNLWVSVDRGYKRLAQEVGNRIGVNYKYLRLFIVSHGEQTFALKSTTSLKRLLDRIPKSQTLDVRYEILNVSLKEFEHMILCHVLWVGQGICREQRHEFYLPNNSCILDLIDRLQTKVNFKPEERDSLLCWTMDRNHRLNSICDSATRVDEAPEFIVGNYPAYKEVMLTKPSNIKLVSGFQFFGQIQNTHSIPFIFDLVDGEMFKDTKQRLHKLLGISDKEFESIRIAATDLKLVKYLDSSDNDSIQLFNLAGTSPFFLAIEHPDRRRTSAYEPSICIK